MAEAQPYVQTLGIFAGGFAALISIVMGMIKVSKLIAIGTKIIEEMGALRMDVTKLEAGAQKLEVGFYANRIAIAWLLGQNGQGMEMIDELVEKAKPPERDVPE